MKEFLLGVIVAFLAVAFMSYVDPNTLNELSIKIKDKKGQISTTESGVKYMTDFKDIQNNPRKYIGKEINIKGKVSRRTYASTKDMAVLRDNEGYYVIFQPSEGTGFNFNQEHNVSGTYRIGQVCGFIECETLNILYQTS